MITGRSRSAENMNMTPAATGFGTTTMMAV